MLLAICVCTYRRPMGLTRAVRAIAEQAKSTSFAVQWRILIVDNDPNGSAARVLDEMGINTDICIDYVREPRRGVGFARNAALNSLRPGESVMFFDDDQVPEPGWFDAMIGRASASHAGVIVGPVRPQINGDVPDWAPDAWAWSRPEYPDGARLSHAGFGNVLIRDWVVADPDSRVREPYLEGPGEDTSVTYRLYRKGVELNYCVAGRAIETVSSDRLTESWAIQRKRRAAEVWFDIIMEFPGASRQICGSLSKNVMLSAWYRVAWWTTGLTKYKAKSSVAATQWKAAAKAAMRMSIFRL